MRSRRLPCFLKIAPITIYLNADVSAVGCDGKLVMARDDRWMVKHEYESPSRKVVHKPTGIIDAAAIILASAYYFNLSHYTPPPLFHV